MLYLFVPSLPHDLHFLETIALDERYRPCHLDMLLLHLYLNHYKIYIKNSMEQPMLYFVK